MLLYKKLQISKLYHIQLIKTTFSYHLLQNFSIKKIVFKYIFLQILQNSVILQNITIKVNLTIDSL